jgi:FkbM family methyltransferase
VFDIGAHVGDRVASFRRLGARVVAVEPQPALIKVLKLLHGRDKAVAIEPIAVARTAAQIELKLNLSNPTVSSACDAFLQAARHARGWQDQRWTRTIGVRAETLDALIGRHGAPAFIKIDVEGLEADVLAGLSHAVDALSFEFTTLLPYVAMDCISRCAALGYRRYNAILGERHAFVHPQWLDAEKIADWIMSLPAEANSGDVYAVQSVINEVRSQ